MYLFLLFSEGSTGKLISEQFNGLFELLENVKSIDIVIIGPSLQDNLIFNDIDLPKGIKSIKSYKLFYHEYFNNVLILNK